MPIKKHHLHYNRNVGGVNYGPIEAILQVFECADAHNLDTSPVGGYRKRDGYEEHFVNEFWDGSEILTTGNGFAGAIQYWERPDTSKHLVWFQTIASGTPRGLVRPHFYQEMPWYPYNNNFDHYEEVPRGTYGGAGTWDWVYT
jgi:hypothetical protein